MKVYFKYRFKLPKPVYSDSLLVKLWCSCSAWPIKSLETSLAAWIRTWNIHFLMRPRVYLNTFLVNLIYLSQHKILVFWNQIYWSNSVELLFPSYYYILLYRVIQKSVPEPSSSVTRNILFIQNLPQKRPH